jgi:hypothetical protein
MMAKQAKIAGRDDEESKRPDNRWRLYSPAAADCRWYFRCADGALGFKAMNPDADGHTDPTTRMLRIADVPKERRIRLALGQLSMPTYRTIALAYGGRQHTPEMRRVLGDFPDLAMRLPRCQTSYQRYREDGGTLDLDVWLTKRCRDKGKADSALVRLRDEAEHAVSDALAAYQSVRTQPTEEELAGEERPARRAPRGRESPAPTKPKIRRRSVLERVRAEIEAKLGRRIV